MTAHACQLAGLFYSMHRKNQEGYEKASLAGLRSISKGEIVCGVRVS